MSHDKEPGAPYPSTAAMMSAVELEIYAALGRVQTVVIGQMIQKAIDAAALSVPPGDQAREAVFGGTNFCGHGVMAVLCDKCGTGQEAMTDNKCSPESEQCVLRNQIEIMGALALLLRYAQPDLVGKAGELDRQRDDLLQRHKATVSTLGNSRFDVAQKPQQPVAWVMPGDDNARDNGSIDAMAWQDGEFSKPLYAAPTQTPPDEEILSLVRVWRECPAERRPSTAALADRIIETLSLSSTTEGNTK